MGRENRAVWAERVARWVDSGLSLEAFALQEGVGVRNLRWWRWRLNSEARAPERRAQRPKFVEVRVSAGQDMAVVLKNGFRVVVPTGFDGPTLGRLLDAVEGR